MPKVAVIIPTYNRLPYVCDAVDSVLKQSYANVECVVVDDASDDDTAEHLELRYGGKIRLIAKDRNGEKSAARNAGIRAVNADYVCMLDSDDLLTPDSVKDRMQVFLDDAGFDGVAFGLSLRDGKSIDLNRFREEEVRGDLLLRYLKSPFVDNNGYMLSRENMLSFGMYRENLTNHEDVELLIRLAARFELRFCGSYAAKIRRIDKSARSNYDGYIRQGIRMIDALRSDPLVVRRLGEKELDRLECREYLEVARSYYKARNMKGYRAYYRKIRARWPYRVFREPRFLKRYLLSFILPSKG